MCGSSGIVVVVVEVPVAVASEVVVVLVVAVVVVVVVVVGRSSSNSRSSSIIEAVAVAAAATLVVCLFVVVDVAATASCCRACRFSAVGSIRRHLFLIARKCLVLSNDHFRLAAFVSNNARATSFTSCVDADSLRQLSLKCLTNQRALHSAKTIAAEEIITSRPEAALARNPGQ